MPKDKKAGTTVRKMAGYSARDMREVSDNPEWTKEDLVKARPFAKSSLIKRHRSGKGRGPNKSPTKNLYHCASAPR